MLLWAYGMSRGQWPQAPWRVRHTQEDETSRRMEDTENGLLVTELRRLEEDGQSHYIVVSHSSASVESRRMDMGSFCCKDCAC